MSNVWKINQTPDYLENKPLTQRSNQKTLYELFYHDLDIVVKKVNMTDTVALKTLSSKQI